MDAGGGMEAHQLLHQIIGNGYVEGENDNIIEVDDVEGENNNDMGAEGNNDVGMEESDAESNVTEESNPPADVDFHGLADIWNEMTVGLESSRDMDRPSSNEHVIKDVEECDHTFILEDDIGYFCRVCGIIQRSIESIIEFECPKLQGSPINLNDQHL